MFKEFGNKVSEAAWYALTANTSAGNVIETAFSPTIPNEQRFLRMGADIIALNCALYKVVGAALYMPAAVNFGHAVERFMQQDYLGAYNFAREGLQIGGLGAGIIALSHYAQLRCHMDTKFIDKATDTKQITFGDPPLTQYKDYLINEKQYPVDSRFRRWTRRLSPSWAPWLINRLDRKAVRASKIEMAFMGTELLPAVRAHWHNKETWN
jgi:hypothetical protein